MTILKPHPYRRPPRSSVGRALERASQVVTHWTGSSWAFALAAAVIVAWLVTGPIFHFSDTWQLVINTGTTIVTFLMVFLIQNTQYRDAEAVQVKLDELLRVQRGAHNTLLDLEELEDDELDRLRALYHDIARKAREELRQG